MGVPNRPPLGVFFFDSFKSDDGFCIERCIDFAVCSSPLLQLISSCFSFI